MTRLDRPHLKDVHDEAVIASHVVGHGLSGQLLLATIRATITVRRFEGLVPLLGRHIQVLVNLSKQRTRRGLSVSLNGANLGMSRMEAKALT